MTYRVSPIPEWTQIFNDTWRWYHDFFYDANMHGRDWQKIGDKFRALLPDLNSRADLNWLLSQMVGELCVSHTYITGGDFSVPQLPANPLYTGLLGADLKPDASGYPRIARLLGPTAYNRDLSAPLVRPDVDVKEADFLVAIDGHVLTTSENPYRWLEDKAGKPVVLTVAAHASGKGSRQVTVRPVASELNLRYLDWVRGRAQLARKLSGGRVGYIHLPDTALSLPIRRC